jgi:hypothetical protein
MGSNQHQIAGRKLRIDASGCVRNNQTSDPQACQQSHAKQDVIQTASFVPMNATFQHKDALIFHLTADQSSMMSHDLGPRHPGDINIIHRNPATADQSIGCTPQSGSQNDTD